MSTDGLERLDADDLGQYVPAVHARSSREAEQYAELLQDHDIPSVVDDDYEPGPAVVNPAPTGRVPVLVPESLLDVARDIIAEFDEMAPYVNEDDEPAGQGLDDDECSALGVTSEEALLEDEEDEDDGQPVVEGDPSDDEDDQVDQEEGDLY